MTDVKQMTGEELIAEARKKAEKSHFTDHVEVMTAPLTPSIEEMERLENLACDVVDDAAPCLCNDCYRLWTAARSFVASAIAAHREKDREIEELRKQARMDEEAMQKAYINLDAGGPMGEESLQGLRHRLAARSKP